MNKFMRMMVFFDLPVKTKIQRRVATRVRSFLLKEISMRKYDLNDAIELKKLNKLLRDVGVSVHSSLLSDFFVFVDEEKYSRVTRRNAGRRRYQC